MLQYYMHSKYNLYEILNGHLFRRIAYYSTTHTTDAVYIIGGVDSENVIAEFKNDQWRQLDDLNTGRYRHGSISIGTETMIIGGASRLVFITNIK